MVYRFYCMALFHSQTLRHVIKDFQFTSSDCLFVCFVALCPKSTAMVMAGRSVHQTHFFLGKLEQAVLKPVLHTHTFACNRQTTLLEGFSRIEENNSRNYFMINLHESMGRCQDRTCDPWICSQTCICC